MTKLEPSVQLCIRVAVPRCKVTIDHIDTDLCPTCQHKVSRHSYSNGCLLCGEEKLRKLIANVPDLWISNV